MSQSDDIIDKMLKSLQDIRKDGLKQSDKYLEELKEILQSSEKWSEEQHSKFFDENINQIKMGRQMTWIGLGGSCVFLIIMITYLFFIKPNEQNQIFSIISRQNIPIYLKSKSDTNSIQAYYYLENLSEQQRSNISKFKNILEQPLGEVKGITKDKLHRFQQSDQDDSQFPEFEIILNTDRTAQELRIGLLQLNWIKGRGINGNITLNQKYDYGPNLSDFTISISEDNENKVFVNHCYNDECKGFKFNIDEQYGPYIIKKSGWDRFYTIYLKVNKINGQHQVISTATQFKLN